MEVTNGATWKMNLEPLVGLLRMTATTQEYNEIPPWVPPYRSQIDSWMKRSAADPPPQCALNQPDVAVLANNSHPRHGKDDRNYPTNRGSGRNPPSQRQQQKREPPCMNQAWSNPAFDNSNTSWEGDWSGTPPIKNDSAATGAFYKHRNPASYQSSSEWSPGESSASNSVPSSYGMMQTPQQSPSNSLSASYYENNGFYGGSGYGYGQGGYTQPQYGQQYQQPVRTGDGASYNNSRNPSNCPPASVKSVADYHRRPNRFGLDGMHRVQIKQEPEEYREMDGENFTSLFTKSLTSLYSQDTENAFPDDGKSYDPDIMICTPTPVPPPEEQTGYQRLHTTSSGQYAPNTTSVYQDGRSNFGFYENRTPTCEPTSTVQDMGPEGDRMNSFRYDRPSFDDMHLYASTPNDTKAQAKKRKVSMPNITTENNFTENRKKTPRLASFKSDSKWTPNSFAFSEIQIKKEPLDDYNTSELETQKPLKDSSSGSNGNGSCSNKTPAQQQDHPKQPPRKRSPGSTCFDRFDKKSTPTNKKVSPLSVYAKVQESIVLTVKCRRYKKRTKPITNKEEAQCPGREEMENYKRSSLTPDQAARQVMNELLERVSLFEEKSVIDGPDLTQMDAMKVRELLMQFCHRYSLDYRDFEDISSILKPRIVKDKMAKNSVRASAIRKRTSTSPVEAEPEPVSRTPKSERGKKKASNEDSTNSEIRVLRKLPGRVDRGRPRQRRSSSKTPVVERRYSTRSAKDVDDAKNSDVDIIIDSSTDRESEAGKEAEVRKKSQRLKNKQPIAEAKRPKGKSPVAETTEQSVVEMSAKEKSLEKTSKSGKVKNREEPYTRSREKRVDNCRDKPEKENQRKNGPKRKLSCLRHMSSSDSLRSSSVEIVDITRSNSPSPSLIDMIKMEPSSPPKISERSRSKNTKLKVETKLTSSRKTIDKSPSPLPTNKRHFLKNKIDRTLTVNLPVKSGTTKRKQEDPTKNSKDSYKNSTLAPTLLESINSKRKQENSSKNTRESAKNSTLFLTLSESFNSKKKQEDTSKHLKESAKNSKVVQTSQESNNSLKLLEESVKNSLSDKKVSTSDSSTKLKTENGKSLNPNSLCELNNSSKWIKLSAKKSPAEIKIDNSPKSLKERYKRAFLDNSSLPYLDPKLHKDCNDKPVKVNSFSIPNNSSKPQKESLKKPTVINLKPNVSTEKDDSAINLKHKSFNTNSNFMNKRNHPRNVFSNLVTKIKEEPITDHEILSNSNPEGSTEKSKIISADVTTEKKSTKVVRNLPIKKVPRRRSSQHSESELQVVLTKLPDVQVSLRNGSVSDEVVRMCEAEQKAKAALAKEGEKKASKDNSDLGKPPELVCMKEISSAQDKVARNFKKDCSLKGDQIKDLVLPNTLVKPINTSANFNSETTQAETTDQPKPLNCHRFSESEDSDCGLVIDLDRRQSVEERVPSPTCQNSNTDESANKAEKPKEPMSTSPKKDATPSVPTVISCPRYPIHEATEEAHILLQLSRGGLPPFPDDLTEPLDSDCPPTINSSTDLTEPLKMDCLPTINNSTDLMEPLKMDCPPTTNSPTDSTESLKMECSSTINSSVNLTEPLKMDCSPTTNSSMDLTEPLKMDCPLTINSSIDLTVPLKGDCPPTINSSMETVDDECPPMVTESTLEQQVVEVKEPDRDESILRTLLLETGDVGPGSSQDMVSQSQLGSSTISADSKASLNQDVMRLLMYQAYQAIAPNAAAMGFDDKKIPLDQLPTDMNANLLTEHRDWGNDPRILREEIKKLKNEIVYLQCMADQKDRERTAIVCFKRYKEEVLRRLLKEYTNNVNDHVRDWASDDGRRSKTEMRNCSDSYQSTSTATSSHSSVPSDDIHPRLSPSHQVLQLAYHATVKTEVPSATVTSGDSISSGENLPTVATMIAKATENYGVDMRTVSRNGSSTTKTILQEVLSSRESIYSPVATGSTLSQEQKIGESVQIFQKTLSTTHESTFSPTHSRSPSLPELSPGAKSTHHFSKRVFSCSSSSSQSPPSLQPEQVARSPFAPGSSSFQKHYPLSLVVSSTDSKTELSKTLHVSTSTSKSLNVTPKSSPRSSPKCSSSSSYSVWSSVQTGRSASTNATSIDLRTDHVKTKDTSKRSSSAGQPKGHAFMLVPPPTTLQSSKHGGHHRSRSEARSERSMTNSVERIYHRKNEDDRHSSSSLVASSISMPYTPSSSVSAKIPQTLNCPPRCMGCGISDAKFLCSGCRKHWYCSAQCQTLRWPEHSRSCAGSLFNSSSGSSYS